MQRFNLNTEIKEIMNQTQYKENEDQKNNENLKLYKNGANNYGNSGNYHMRHYRILSNKKDELMENQYETQESLSEKDSAKINDNKTTTNQEKKKATESYIKIDDLQAFLYFIKKINENNFNSNNSSESLQDRKAEDKESNAVNYGVLYKNKEVTAPAKLIRAQSITSNIKLQNNRYLNYGQNDRFKYEQDILRLHNQHLHNGINDMYNNAHIINSYKFQKRNGLDDQIIFGSNMEQFTCVFCNTKYIYKRCYLNHMKKKHKKAF